MPKAPRRTRSESMPIGTRRCTGETACSCRACVLNRWDTTQTKSDRAGHAWIDGSSRRSSSSPRSSASSDTSQAPAPIASSSRPFGLAPLRTVDEFVPTNGRGPTISLEARRSSELEDELEQTLTLADLKLTIAADAAAAPAALSERVVTVSKRRRGDDFEVIFLSRGLSPSRRPASVDALAALSWQRSAARFESGDAAAVAALLEGAARSYGTSVPALLDAVHAVAPSCGAQLAELSC